MQQKLVFASLYMGYMLNVYLRRSVTFNLPEITKSEGMDKHQLGIILSSQMLAYAVSKFISGILLDFISPAKLLSLSLIATGISAYLFASVPSSLLLFTLIWTFNGMACSPGWPASALIMKKWFHTDQFGTAWSLLSTSMNVAGTIGPLVTAYITAHSDWRSSLFGSGCIIICIGLLLMATLKDSPDDYSPHDKTSNKDKDGIKDKKMSRKAMFKRPGYTGVCLAYCVTSLVQYGTLQWGPVYLVNELGHSMLKGNSFVSSLELGGICGSVLAGFSSDYLLSKRPGQSSQLVRQYVIAWFAAGLGIFLYFFTYCVSRYSSMMWISIVGFGLGMCVYGPISIFGVTAMECVPNNMAGTAHAISCLFASFGQTVAGFPLSYMSKFWGWKQTFLLEMLMVAQMAAYLFFYTAYRHQSSPTREKKD